MPIVKAKNRLWFFFVVFGFMPLHAQISPFGLEGGKTTGLQGLRFRQDLNTYVWLMGIDHQFQWRQRWQLRVQQHFKSSMLRLGVRQDKWKDEEDFSTVLHYRLFAKMRVLSEFRSLAFFDKQSGFNNDIRSLSMGFGFQYMVTPQLQFLASAGPRWESRLNRRDNGRYYTFNAQADAFAWGEYRHSARVMWASDDFGSRTNHDAQIDYRVGRTFTAGSADSLRLFFNQRRRDNYVGNEGEVESQREGAKGCENNLSYGIVPGVLLRLQNSYLLRTVELVSYTDARALRRRKRNDEIGDHTLIIEWRPKRGYGRLTLNYFLQTQKYDISRSDDRLPFSQRTAFITPDNESNRLFLGAEGAAALGRKDSVYYYTSISRFQYDTPDSNNFDDRDELRINSKWIWSHVIGPHLHWQVQATVNLYHMVYIFGERSADNNWNRIIRLRPQLTFSPYPQWRWLQAFEVSANYVDYDFEMNQAPTKSYVFRKFAYDDSVRFHISSHLSSLIDYRLQLEENGELYWQRWRERLLTTRTSHWLQVRLAFAANPSLQWAPGYAFYSRDEWRYQLMNGIQHKEKYQTFVSHGPLLDISYLPSQKIRLVFDAVRRKVLPFRQKSYYITTFDLRIDLFF